MCPKIGIKGIYYPRGLPKDSSYFPRKIVASLVPDGVSLQPTRILSKSEREILSELGVMEMEENRAMRVVKDKGR